MKWLIPAIFFLASLPLQADGTEEALDKSKALLKCVPLELHYAELARQSGDDVVLKAMEGMMRGTVGAATILLREAGYTQRQISSYMKKTVGVYDNEFQSVVTDKQQLESWGAECTATTTNIQTPILEAQRKNLGEVSLL